MPVAMIFPDAERDKRKPMLKNSTIDSDKWYLSEARGILEYVPTLAEETLAGGAMWVSSGAPKVSFADNLLVLHNGM